MEPNKFIINLLQVTFDWIIESGTQTCEIDITTYFYLWHEPQTFDFMSSVLKTLLLQMFVTWSHKTHFSSIRACFQTQQPHSKMVPGLDWSSFFGEFHVLSFLLGSTVLWAYFTLSFIYSQLLSNTESTVVPCCCVTELCNFLVPKHFRILILRGRPVCHSHFGNHFILWKGLWLIEWSI